MNEISIRINEVELQDFVMFAIDNKWFKLSTQAFMVSGVRIVHYVTPIGMLVEVRVVPEPEPRD